MIGGFFIRSIEIWYLEETTRDDEIVAEKNASDGRKENLVRGKERDENASGLEKVPRLNCYGDDGADEKTGAD